MRNRAAVLDLAILGRLADGPLHGYELRKQLAATLGPFRALSFGSLYPRLRALEAEGWVETGAAGQAPHVLTGRRARVEYSLTADGKEYLADVLAASDPAAWDDDSFDVRFSMFAVTDPQTRLRILEGRRTRVLERREAFRASSQRIRERRDAYTLELQRHGLEQLDREVGWLEGLIANERASEAPSAPATSGLAAPPPGSVPARHTTTRPSGVANPSSPDDGFHNKESS